MKSVLKGDVDVVRFAAFAEMAWLEPRPELAALCRAARDSSGGLLADTVSNVLAGVSEVGVRNILSWCIDLGLCERSGALTRLGETVADTGEAPVPEQGVYDFWVVDHPLLGRRILHVDRLTWRQDGRYDRIERLSVRPEEGRTYSSVVSAGSRFVLRNFPSNHGEVDGLPQETRAVCRLRWTLDFEAHQNRFELSGELDSPRDRALRPIRQALESVEIDLWEVARGWADGPLSKHGRWDSEARRQAVPFAGLSEEEQENFRKTLDLGTVEVPGFGTWDDVRLEATPIGPISDSDATAWALARLDRRLIRCRHSNTRAEVRRLFLELTEQTPLEPMRPTLESHEQLLSRYRSSPDVFWRLAAPVDLAVESPTEEELGPMTVGRAKPRPRKQRQDGVGR